MKQKMLPIIYLFLLVQPILDLGTSLMVRYVSFPITIGIAVRGVFLALMLVYFCFFSRAKDRKKWFIYFGLLGLFGVIYFALKFTSASWNQLFQEVIYFFKFMYFPIMLGLLVSFFQDQKPDQQRLHRIMIIDLILFGVLILLPLFTNTSFDSYLGGGEGNIGWFYAANEISASLTILFAYLFTAVVTKKAYWLLLLFLPVVIAMAAIGTKTAFLGMIIPTGLCLLYALFTVRKNTARPLIIVSLVLVMIVCASPDLPVIKNLQASIERANQQNQVNQNDPSSPDHTGTQVMLSGRNEYFKNVLHIYQEASFSDQLVGIGFTNRSTIHNGKIEKLIEMDPFDIFFRYGIIGCLFYFAPLIMMVASSGWQLLKKRQFTFLPFLYLYVIGIALAVSLIAGHVLGAPAVSFYLAITVALLVLQLNLKEE